MESGAGEGGGEIGEVDWVCGGGRGLGKEWAVMIGVWAGLF